MVKRCRSVRLRIVGGYEFYPSTLFISGHASCAEDRIIVRGADTHIGSVFPTVVPSDEASGIKYMYLGGPIAPSSTGSGFGTTPLSTKGFVKLRLAACRAARSLRMASQREGSFKNSAKKRLVASFRS
jgi:urease alpha subunit